MLRSESASHSPAAEAYFPPPEAQGGWRSLVPANEAPTADQKKTVLATTGLAWDRLREVWEYCQSHAGQHKLLVIRHGWVAGEWHDYADPSPIHSCTKALVGLAMARLFDLSDAGRLPTRVQLDDEAWRFLPPEWAEAEPARKRITLRHLLTMTSGLTPHDGAYEGSRLPLILGLPLEAAPGTVWAYSSGSVDLLSVILQNLTGQTLEAFFNSEVEAAIGAEPSRWRRFRGSDHSHGGGGASFTPRELARVGYLVLQGGAWRVGGELSQVISAQRVTEFTQAARWLESTRRREPNFAFEPNSNRYYGHLWWTNRTGEALGDAAPRDVVYMSGWGKQACFVAPSLDMVAIRLGRDDGELNKHPRFYHGFWTRLMAALADGS